MMEEPYVDQTESATSSGAQAVGQDNSKLPPILANLITNMGNTNRSPQMPGNPTPTPASNPALNVQELLTSIMVRDCITSRRAMSTEENVSKLCVYFILMWSKTNGYAHILLYMLF